MSAMKKIVLTGGPGAGKTVISTRLAALEPIRFLQVPEAATRVYDILQTRWDRLDIEGQRDVQRRIYRLQIETENAYQTHDRALILDRGTIDGSAYWPDGPDNYWKDLNTTLSNELNRYDAVIWLETAAVLDLYDGEASNFCRFENAPAAIASGQLLLRLWNAHPKLRIIRAFPSLDEKVAAVRQMLRDLSGT
jgi:predicted ATPase